MLLNKIAVPVNVLAPCFNVQVPNRKSDHRNRIVLELVGFEGPKDFPRLFGTVTMHLYEVIQVRTMKGYSLERGLY